MTISLVETCCDCEWTSKILFHFHVFILEETSTACQAVDSRLGNVTKAEKGRRRPTLCLEALQSGTREYRQLSRRQFRRPWLPVGMQPVLLHAGEREVFKVRVQTHWPGNAVNEQENGEPNVGGKFYYFCFSSFFVCFTSFILSRVMYPQLISFVLGHRTQISCASTTCRARSAWAWDTSCLSSTPSRPASSNRSPS